MSRGRRSHHPLQLFFWANRANKDEGMLMLLNNGEISPECVEPEDVSEDDMIAIFVRRNLTCYLPAHAKEKLKAQSEPTDRGCERREIGDDQTARQPAQ